MDLQIYFVLVILYIFLNIESYCECGYSLAFIETFLFSHILTYGYFVL